MKNYLHLWSLSALLVLTGCATTTSQPEANKSEEEPQSTVAHTPSYPRGPLSPINSASVQRNGVANLAVPDDLWTVSAVALPCPICKTTW